MKKAYLVVTGVFILLIMLVIILYFSLFYSTGKTKDLKKMDLINSSTEAIENNTGLLVGAVEAGSKGVVNIKEGTIITQETIDVYDNSFTSNQIEVPSSYLGLTKEELQTQLNNERLALNEVERKGVLSIEVTSFQDNHVVIRKTINSELLEYEYYIGVKNGYVVVFYKDKQTIFETTAIAYTSLPEDFRQQVMEGIYVASLEELYSLLESMSS